MNPRITSLVVEDFRSIRGFQRISLDAPIVLIHGPNGTGKTSLLSAIEFALSGSVSSFARFDPEYIEHLPHKLGANGRCRVQIEATGLKASSAEVYSDGKLIWGDPLLDSELARFFTERCYLPQAALGRLLEIYEHQDSRRTDSPLTRFVKELLGLEALDALIDGLHSSGDVRRLRDVAPQYWVARSDAAPAAKRLSDAEAAYKLAVKGQEGSERILKDLIDGLIPLDALSDIAVLESLLENLRRQTEERLIELALRLRKINSAVSQLAEAPADQAKERQELEATALETRETLDKWNIGPGADLRGLLESIRNRFPQVIAPSKDLQSAYETSLSLVAADLARLQGQAEAEQAGAKALLEVKESLRQGRSRLSTIDNELAQDKGANQALAQALTAISSHIRDETCPVCSRDYSEVSEGALAAHVSEEVHRLISAAGRVEGLVRDRATTMASISQAERKESELTAKSLSPSQSDALKLDIALLTEWKNGLMVRRDAAATGAQLQLLASASARELSVLNSRQAGISGLRSELKQHADALGYLDPFEDFSLEVSLANILSFAQKEELAAQNRLDRLKNIAEAISSFLSARKTASAASDALEVIRTDTEAANARRAEAERKIAVGKGLAARALALRSAKVRQVFSDELNSVWRELFIRLAPEEAFVPAFALPSSSNGTVEAVLETLYRSGGKGGNPRAMLSAGNLNTAALTLFLALNLSVRPQLPWLIIDDPVQSMDDVHIAQFAALLRTLKLEGRQVILAVHDRQLFDYLSLELSPTFNGDRLITVELGRSADGLTTAQWIPTVFEPDRAFAA
ncbi:AAA family ATPase [Thioclava sp. FR2]|uniref:AAA family ATPase n=1 Tax=Thioclava sp. FR2 TaxID=3445780 RepID=UPI003EBE570A